MREHWEFFKEQDRSFGVFYPLHYVVAAFETPERAEEVRKIFVDSGFDDGDVASTTGSFVTTTSSRNAARVFSSSIRLTTLPSPRRNTCSCARIRFPRDATITREFEG